jgi:hypothetical protein
MLSGNKEREVPRKEEELIKSERGKSCKKSS